MKCIGWIFFLCLALFSCSSHVDTQVSRFHDDGRGKPVVALIPIFDQSNAKVSWDLSEEFTTYLKQRLLKRGRFYLTSPEEIYALTTNLTDEHNPFGSHLTWIKRTFDAHEFVIFAELSEHNIHPKPLKNSFLDKLTPSYELSMTMRVRVFDLRAEEPKVILQELIHQSHLIPKPSNLIGQASERWKKMTFMVSPMGLAHSQFSKEVSKRIEDYILLAQSY